MRGVHVLTERGASAAPSSSPVRLNAPVEPGVILDVGMPGTMESS